VAPLNPLLTRVPSGACRYHSFTPPLLHFLADSSEMGTIAKFLFVLQDTHNMGISPSGSAGNEALSR
jgi:hypothetical protein